MMNTVKLLSIFGLFLFATAATGQAQINPDIKSKLDAYIEYSNQQNWDKAFDLLYPKLFAQVSKQDLVNLMKDAEADGMSIQMNNARITSTSAPFEEGTETFVRVEYEADVIVNIVKDGIYDAPKAVQAMEEQFKSTYGRKVNWDASKRTFEIRAKKSIMAIRTDNKKDWYLVEINMDQPELMNALFPASVMEALVRVE